jgi:hypothetical protein
MTLAVSQTIQRQMIGLLTNGELERIWKESFVASLRHYSGISREGPRKSTKHLRNGIRSPGIDSKSVPPVYETGVLIIWPQHSVLTPILTCAHLF